MADRFDRVAALSRPPAWVSAPVAAGTVLVFVVSLPLGLDPVGDVLVEGLYLLVAVVALLPVQQFDSGVLNVGWQLFVLGRLIDFLDELFVEPEPLVEPYLSGLLMVVSLSVLVLGVYAVLDERDRRIEDLERRTEELSLKNDVIDEAPIGITVADMTRADEPLISVNDGFTRMTGYGEAETIGRNCRFLQGAETDEQQVARMREAIDAGTDVQVTLRNYRKDGTRFWNEVTLAPIRGDDGAVDHYAGFQQVVTERKEYERQLRQQRDDLDVLSQVLQHDIGNKLQLVTAHAGRLEEHVAADGRDHLDVVTQAAEDAIAVTETARDLSDAMLGTDPERHVVSLADTLEGEIRELRTSFESATVETEGTIDDVGVEADELLDSLFRNILRNAVQHNDTEHPEVTVSTSRREGRVVVRIADNGPGIPDERKEAVFGRGTKGLESEGTGIGTYLIDTLATRYGGDVWIEDNVPEGAVFVVELPVAGG